jgi:ATP-dependent exoDNAse (exonuclease V) alpha subunit
LTLHRKDILVIDEAGMVGSRLLKRLLDHATVADAKVVLVGDHRQLQPIEAGGVFRLLQDTLGHVALTDIRRQRAAWAREAVHQLAAGRAAEALASYHERGLLTLSEDRETAREQMVRDWLAERSPSTSSLLLTDTREECQQLNELARQRLQARGELSGGITLATAHGARELAPGERLLFTRNSTLYGLSNGTLGTLERFGMPAHQHSA